MAKKATPRAIKKTVPKSAKKVASTVVKKTKKVISKAVKKAKQSKSVTPKAFKRTAPKAFKSAAPKVIGKTAPRAATKTEKPVKTVSTQKVANKTTTNLDFTKILTPLDDRILVEAMPTEKQTASGLILIDSSPDTYHRAKVLAVGRGRRNKFGKIRPLDVQTGDSVLYSPHTGSEFKVSGLDLFIIRESDVLGVIED